MCVCVHWTGVLVDHTDNDLMSAFRVMLQQHNNKQPVRLRVKDETRMLPMDNSFSVGTASAYTAPVLNAVAGLVFWVSLNTQK